MKMNFDIKMKNNSISGIRQTDVYKNQNGKMVMKTDIDMNNFHDWAAIFSDCKCRNL